MTGATRPIASFVDDLSNWYVRRSRRRFWKSGDDADKQSAYATLYECLVTVSKLLAPFMPFTADAMYRNLVGSVDQAAPESVHLAAWPQAPQGRVDEQLVSDTRLVMKLVSLGHAARNTANVKVRQPLAKVAVQRQDPMKKPPPSSDCASRCSTNSTSRHSSGCKMRRTWRR